MSPIAHGIKIKKRLDKLVGAENSEGWQIRDIRRTTSTNLGRLGVRDIVIGMIANHSRARVQGVTSIYNRHDYLKETKEALQKYSEWLDDLIDGD